MKEIEVKLELTNVDSLQKKVEELGCIFSPPKLQEDRIYISNDRDFPKLFPGDNALRIRTVQTTNETKYIFTLKQQTNNGLAKIEKELEIKDPTTMHEAILLLGYKETSRVKKSRITTKYNAMEICLDRVEKLGDFIELEIMGEDTDVLQNEMMEFLKALGCDISKRVEVGYDVLMFQRGLYDN